MKIRDDDKHVQELLQVNVIERIVSVLENCNPGKYKFERISRDVLSGLQKLGEEPMPHEKRLAERLCSDITDVFFCISVLHEMCRYRSGCVALAQHKKCLGLLLTGIPFQGMNGLGMGLMVKFFLADGIGVGTIGGLQTSWENLMKFNFGMMEQSTIDTLGRLLNGLDKHTSLRVEVGELIKAKIDDFEEQVKLLTPMISDLEDPQVGHCINLKGSLSRLRKMLSSLDSKPKAWRSTFRIDRHLVPRNDSSSTQCNGGGEDDDEKVDPIANKKKCRVCTKTLQKPLVCSRCRTVFYCSRDCQRVDWGDGGHKQNCVKHRDNVPVDAEWSGEQCKQMVNFLTAKLAELETNNSTTNEE